MKQFGLSKLIVAHSWMVVIILLVASSVNAMPADLSQDTILRIFSGINFNDHAVNIIQDECPDRCNDLNGNSECDEESCGICLPVAAYTLTYGYRDVFINPNFKLDR